MKDTLHHTYHPNTFGLLYGKTTKTACGKRRETDSLVKPLETDCLECQDTVIADMRETQGMANAVHDLHAKGYISDADYAKCAPNEMTNHSKGKEGGKEN